MRSLFLKIFLWFWATVVVVGAALVITWSMQSEVVTSRWRASTSDAVKIYAQSAAEEVDRYGVDALNNYLQRLDSSAHIRAALLDETGQPIAGKLDETGRALEATPALAASPNSRSPAARLMRRSVRRAPRGAVMCSWRRCCVGLLVPSALPPSPSCSAMPWQCSFPA